MKILINSFIPDDTPPQSQVLVLCLKEKGILDHALRQTSYASDIKDKSLAQINEDDYLPLNETLQSHRVPLGKCVKDLFIDLIRELRQCQSDSGLAERLHDILDEEIGFKSEHERLAAWAAREEPSALSDTTS